MRVFLCVIFGNIVVIVLLLLIVVWLLGLYQQDVWWQSVLLFVCWSWVVGSVLVYVVFCVVVWWWGCLCDDIVSDSGLLLILLVWFSQIGFVQQLCECSVDVLCVVGVVVCVCGLYQIDVVILQQVMQILFVVSIIGEGDVFDYVLLFLCNVML